MSLISPEQLLKNENAQTNSLLNGNLNPVAGVNSDNTSPASDSVYTSPTQTGVPDISGLAPQFVTPPTTPTAQEGQQTDLIAQIRALNDANLGKTAYQNQNEIDAGLPDLQKQQTDLGSQVTALVNEQKDLQNKYNYTIPNLMQENATGRGITVGGLAPMTASELRKNQIAQGSVASRALSVSSALDAVNGLVQSAQAKADKATALKYNPIQEQITALTNNLNLIINDPATKLADKNRAQAQLDIQNQKQAELNSKISEAKTLNDYGVAMATKYGDVGIIPGVDTFESIAQKMRQSAIYKKDVQLQVDKGTSDMQNYNFARSQGYTGTFETYLNTQKAAGAGVLAGGLGGVSLGGQDLGTDVQKQNLLDYQTSNQAYNTISATLKAAGVTPETLTAEVAGKLSDIQVETIGKAIGRMQNPDIARMGGDPGNVFSPTGVGETIQQFFGTLSGKKYIPEKIVEAVRNAADIQFGRTNALQSGNLTPIGSIVPSASASGGQTVDYKGYKLSL